MSKDIRVKDYGKEINRQTRNDFKHFKGRI
jgi:hypothetical protein